MIVLNIFGVPGSKKDKYLSLFYSQLVQNDIKVQIIGSFNIDVSKNPLKILGDVVDKLDSAKQEDVILSISPLLLQSVYYRQSEEPEPDMFEILSYKKYQCYQNINILIDDPKDSYLFKDVKSLLDRYDIPYDLVRSPEDIVCTQIVSNIVHRIKGTYYEP